MKSQKDLEEAQTSKSYLLVKEAILKSLHSV
jgi:hypothetical protein